MSRHEQALLALILAGFGGGAATGIGAAETVEAGGGTLQIGAFAVAVTACGDKDDDSGDDGDADTDADTDTDGGDDGGEDSGGETGGDTVEGRPFTVADRIRTASITNRADWVDPTRMDLTGLSRAHRRRLIAYFLKVAAAEHASVASFHRVALELLHLGAPPKLLQDTQAAATDEIRHARIAYGLAEDFGAPACGPGPLDITGALDVDLSPAGIMRRLVDEACVGETISALLLRESATRCQDAGLRCVLTEIAEDEEGHAALGWRTLHWLLQQHPDLRGEARDRIASAFDATMPDIGESLEEWGVLSAETRAQVRERTFLAVLLPAAEALR